MTCVDRVQHPSDRGVSCCLQHCFGFASRFADNPKRAATTPSATTRLCFWLGLACLCCIVQSFTTDPTIYRRHKMEDTVRFCQFEGTQCVRGMAILTVHTGCQEGVGPPQARLTSSSDVVTASCPCRAPERQHECAKRHTAAHGERKTQALEL
jgi:hypothetical protein